MSKSCNRDYGWLSKAGALLFERRKVLLLANSLFIIFTLWPNKGGNWIFASRRPAISPTKAEPLPNLIHSFLIYYDQRGIMNTFFVNFENLFESDANILRVEL